MNEIKGSIIAIMFTLAFVFPAIINITLETNHNQAFQQHVAEITEHLKQNGGINTQVRKRFDELTAEGYVIKITDNDNQEYNGFIPYGKEVTVNVWYGYNGMFDNQTLHTAFKIRHYHRQLQ